MQLNEIRNAAIFVIFIEPETQEANSLVDSCVMEWRYKFSCGNITPSIGNLRIVYTIVFMVTLGQMAAFTFLTKSDENVYFLIRTCNNLNDLCQLLVGVKFSIFPKNSKQTYVTLKMLEW